MNNKLKEIKKIRKKEEELTFMDKLRKKLKELKKEDQNIYPMN